MKRSLSVLVFALLVTCLITNDAWSRGGRGGGGGGSRGGGGGGHAMARPSGGGGNRGGGYGGASRTPSMSRPQARPASRPNVSRPNTGGSHPSRPANGANRPNLGAGSRPNTNRPSTGGSRPNINRPSTGGSRPDINRPGTGGSRPNVNRPSVNRPGSGNNRPSHSDRPSAGDLGNFLGLPGDNRPATRPGHVDRPGHADRPNLGSRPNVNVNNRKQVNINNRHNANSIRNHWSHADRRPFDKNWWGRYPATLPGWRCHAGWHRYPGSWYWQHARWPVFGTWFVWQWNEPVVYSYGTNVVYRDNNVYIDDQQVATTDDYYQEAKTIADSVPEDVDTEQIEWMPLGVFAIAEQGGTDSGMLVQLAVSKEGILAGTFYTDTTDEGRPLEGTVDRKTQRAAWNFADDKNPDVVMETSVYNLTQDETTALVHFGSEKTQTWLMVRLPESDEETK